VNDSPNENMNQYREIQVETATTLNLVQMAYNSIIENLNEAAASLQSTPKSNDIFNQKMAKAQEIVSALDDGLDNSQGELSILLANFYTFLRQKLIESNVAQSLDGVMELVDVVEQVRDYWMSVPSESENNEDENRVSSTDGGSRQEIDLTG